jgi:hypothetical protein
MTTPDWTSLRSKYEELSELFITEVNKTTVVLYYPPQTALPSIDTPFSDRPSIVDGYGGRVPLNSLPERQDQDGSNLSVTPTTETIIARTYLGNKSMDPILKKMAVNDTKNFCKLITYNEYSFKLKNADYIIVDNNKYRLIQDPAGFGMFGRKQYCVSFWEQQ